MQQRIYKITRGNILRGCFFSRMLFWPGRKDYLMLFHNYNIRTPQYMTLRMFREDKIWNTQNNSNRTQQ